MAKLQQQALDIVLADPAVAGVGSSVGASGFNASVNQGRMFISLKPLAERDGSPPPASSTACAASSPASTGLSVFLCAAQDIRVGARQSQLRVPVHALEPRHRRALRLGAEGRRARCAGIPGLVDVTTDREQGGLQASVTIDRQAAARLGVRIAGHQQRAQQRLLAAPDVDHLHAAQPVSRHPRGRPALPARPADLQRIYRAGQRTARRCR